MPNYKHNSNCICYLFVLVQVFIELLSSSYYFYDKVVSLADVSLFYLLAVCFLYLFSLLIKDIFVNVTAIQANARVPRWSEQR